jgi:hypothetical protein
MRASIVVPTLAIMLGGTALSLAQQNAQGAVELSNGTKVLQNPSLPKTQPHEHAARADSQGCAN